VDRGHNGGLLTGGKNLAALDWYATSPATQGRGSSLRSPFGLDPKFKDVYRKNDSILRMALLEKE
jgi:hypothetical protein